MKLSEKQSQLIYQCASEAVMQARIKVARLLVGHPDGVKIDMILAHAMDDAGSWAIMGATADTRKLRTGRAVILHNEAGKP